MLTLLGKNMVNGYATDTIACPKMPTGNRIASGKNELKHTSDCSEKASIDMIEVNVWSDRKYPSSICNQSAFLLVVNLVKRSNAPTPSVHPAMRMALLRPNLPAAHIAKRPTGIVQIM